MKSEIEKKLYTLNEINLQRGDIILTTSKHKVGNVIRAVTMGPFSHASLYMGDYSCLEAGGPGIRVTSDNIQRIFFDSPNHCAVLRLKESISDFEMDEVVTYARQMVGMEYSVPEARLVLLRKTHKANEINRQFCSRFVAQAYEKAGIILVKNPDYCSPVDIYNSNKLIKVEGHLRIATEEEIKIFNEPSEVQIKKDFAHDYLLSKSRELTGSDIQTFEQFTKYVVDNPQFDKQFSQILHDSGYLTLWAIEKRENPELYDFNLFKEKAPDLAYLRYIGYDMLLKETETRKRLNQTLNFLNKQ